MTITVAAPAGTAEDVARLLADRQCSAQCLLAAEADGACRCRCNGLHHGEALRQLAGEHPRPRDETAGSARQDGRT